jgi:hypothetical protein
MSCGCKSKASSKIIDVKNWYVGHHVFVFDPVHCGGLCWPSVVPLLLLCWTHVAHV